MSLRLVPPVHVLSTNIRFPIEGLRFMFSTTTFIPMHTKYLSRTFFMRSCVSNVEVIDNYGLKNFSVLYKFY